MVKRSFFTEITALPKTVSRETAVAWLHDHHDMIELNPLVIAFTATTAPPNATADELAYMTWYEITDSIQYIPGTSVKGQVTYKGGFYNLPDGLQTHVFSPGGVDLLAKWSVGGNVPGELREPVELGIDKPRDGLYLREDVELRCNVLLTSFIKRNLKKGHAVLVQKLLEKAESIPQARGQLERPDTFRSAKSDTGVARYSHTQTATPPYSDTRLVANTSQEPNNLAFRRSGTVCNCTGEKHIISCPNYTRIYKPPALYTEPPQHAYPTPQPQSSTAHSPALNFTNTPPSTYPTEDSSALLLRDAGATNQPYMSSLHPASHSNAASNSRPWEVNSGQAIASTALKTYCSGEIAEKSRSGANGRQPSQAHQTMAVELEGDPESAARYYNYQARMSELP